MNSVTQLYRQVHPKFVQNNRVTSQAFRPNENDEGLLSVYDGDQITPKSSWEHYTSELELRSAGVVAVTVGECESLGIDAILDGVPYPEHASLNLSIFTTGELKNIAKLLRKQANDRGWLFRP